MGDGAFSMLENRGGRLPDRRRRLCKAERHRRHSTTLEQDPIAQEIVAELGPMTLSGIAYYMDCTKEMVRYLESRALRKLRAQGVELEREAG